MRYKCISQEGLKLIACLSMFIDHLGASLILRLPGIHMPVLYYACRTVGRLAFPIYAFLLAQGVKHTGNGGKYLLRLAIGMVLSELPFDLLFEGGISWERQSVMLTLVLGAAMGMMQRRAEPIWAKALLITPFALLADLLRCDYGGTGVIMVGMFLLTDVTWVQILGVTLCCMLIPSANIPFFGMQLPIQLFAVLAMLVIWLYSGSKLLHSRVLQWAFYLFYPLHMLLLWVLQGFLF